MVELLSFLGGWLLVTLPGIAIASRLHLGRSRLENLGLGSALGLALSIYVSSLCSHLDLRLFLPLWTVVFLAAMVAWLSGQRVGRVRGERLSSADRWVLFILLLVAVTRFAVALPPHFVPRGWDPSFHSILARKIQLTHHSISDWSPFDPITLNYPTGSHVLLAILSNVTRLPIHTVFKDMMPMLGVMTTLMVYLFARRATGSDDIALYSATAYGLWAMLGSIGYAMWGGLPNEMAMLLFIALLTAWLQKDQRGANWLMIVISLAAIVLTHHHVMLVCIAILIPLAAWAWVKGSKQAAVVIVTAGVGAVVLDAFFVIPYLLKIATLRSTHVLHGGEKPIALSAVPGSFGYVFFLASVAGLLITLFGKKRRVHFAVGISVAVLLALFVMCEYLYPWMGSRSGHAPATMFTPSRFLTDLSCFICVFCGVAISAAGRVLPRMIIMIVCIALGATLWGEWTDLAQPSDQSQPAYFAACKWIGENTPADTVVVAPNTWTSYASWRRSTNTPIPDSEPLDQVEPCAKHVQDILAGTASPDSAGMKIVRIREPGEFAQGQLLWEDKGSGFAVLQLWPK